MLFKRNPPITRLAFPPPPKMPACAERSLLIKYAIEALQKADEAWCEAQLDAWLLAADAILATVRRPASLVSGAPDPE